MKAIIIAAGVGSRLGDLTKDKPKCLLQINGKSIIEHQIDVLNANKISNISIIKGYLAELIDIPGCSYYINDDYLNNNILLSLMCAEAEFNDALIATYSDVIYSSEAIRKIKNDQDDISVLMDTNWQANYINRNDHPISEAEKIICDDNNQLIHIGKDVPAGLDFSGEFIGALKCSAKGAQIFRDSFNEAKCKFDGKPFIRARSFRQAYVTDMLQYMADRGIKINCVPVNGECFEIDTEEDFQKVINNLSKG